MQKEFLMWKATMKDGSEILEFNTEDNKIIETPFSVIQENENLVRFSLIGEGFNIYFDKNGIFTLGDYIFEFNIHEKNSDINLLDGKKNRLIMYRTNALSWTGEDSVMKYTYGYRVNNELTCIKAKMSIGVDGVKFIIEITSNIKDLDIVVDVYQNNSILGNLNTFIEKGTKKDVTVVVKTKE